MGLFGKKKDQEDEHYHQNHELHDPIMTAIHEQQPWEQQTGEITHTVSPSGALRDVFGNPITNPDISNPARSREERPLDTIRGFEYASTGDERLREMGESSRLGFRPRQNFTSMPRMEANPYDRQVISFGDPSVAENENKGVYYPPSQTANFGIAQEETKKKRGLFGRKK